MWRNSVGAVYTGGETVYGGEMDIWQQRVVDYARVKSQAQWTPVAGSIPIRRRGAFKTG